MLTATELHELQLQWRGFSARSISGPYPTLVQAENSHDSCREAPGD